MNTNTVLRYTQGRVKTRHCDSADCSEATKHGKHICSEHISELPYIRDLEARIEARHIEERLVQKAGWRAVNVNASISTEILQVIKNHGKISLPSLCRYLNRDISIHSAYIMAFTRAGLVRATMNSREIVILQLT